MGRFREKLQKWHTSDKTQTSQQDPGTPSSPERHDDGLALKPSHPSTPSLSLTQRVVEISNGDTVTVQAEVWNDAYDELKRDDARMIDTYERILSDQLQIEESVRDEAGYPENVIQPRDGRQDQLKKLIQEGQSRNEPVASLEDKANNVIERFKPLRGVISEVVKINPVASIAWVGITAVLDILASPLSEPGANREGMEYVLDRAEWYWNLSALLLSPKNIPDTILELQKTLRASIMGLYKKLLLYQIKSVCLYSRCHAAVIMRDLVKLDDWKAHIKSIQEAEHDVENNTRQFRSEDTGAQLREINKCLGGVRADIQDLTAVVQDFANDQQNLREEERDNDFLRDLYEHSVHPKLEKEDIEKLKGGLLREPHELVLEQSNFEDLRNDPKTKTLWVTGGPGRGKTMFLCGIIDRLLQQPQYNVVTYFLCKADKTATRTANSVMLGLLRLVCDQSWAMTRHLRKKYGNQVRSLIKDENATASGALEMLNEALKRPSMQQATIIIDAIDECETNSIEVLIRAIGQLSLSHGAQWIVSSRTFEKYRGSLAMAAREFTSCLELNENVVSRAIQAFVNHRVTELSNTRGYDDELRRHVHKTLSSKANGTFLWVALVCLELGRLGIEARHVKEKLDAMPQGLNDLYKHMLDAALDTNACDHKSCGKILRLACVTSRPITLDELCAFVPELCQLTDSEIRSVVANCGSFLNVQGIESSSAALAFVHESAREYLTGEAQRTMLPDGIHEQHRFILGQALSIIRGLTRNIYQLPFDGFKSSEIVPPTPDPLSRLRYSCLHWLDHAVFLQSRGAYLESQDEKIESFICNDLLHWLEALSLMRNMPQGAAGFQKLSRFYSSSGKPKSRKLEALVESARSFILYNKTCIEMAPLQVYSSAILFCPHFGSKIKRQYQHELNWVTLHPTAAGATRPQIVREHQSGDTVHSMEFSHDGRFLALAFTVNEGWIESSYVETWDVLACHRIQSVNVKGYIRNLGFSDDGTEILVVLKDSPSPWININSGRSVDTLMHPSGVYQALFSPRSKFLGLRVWGEEKAFILEVGEERVIQTLDDVYELTFSPDNLHLATVTEEQDSVTLWRIGSQKSLWTVANQVEEVIFFGNDLVAARTSDDRITIRAISDGTEVHALSCNQYASLIDWLGTDLSYLCHCPMESMIKVLDNTGEKCVRSYPVIGADILKFSPATHVVAWADSAAIKSWDLRPTTWESDVEPESSESRLVPTRLTFSQNTSNDTILASWTPSTNRSDPGVTIWSFHQGKVSKLSKLPVSSEGQPYELKFSPSGKKLVKCDVHGYFKIWDAASGSSVRGERRINELECSAFAPNDKLIAFGSTLHGVRLWDLEAQEFTKTIPRAAAQLSFSHDCNSLAIAHNGHVGVWNVSASEEQPRYTLDLEHEPQDPPWKTALVLIAFSPDDNSLAVATNKYVHVWSVSEAEPRCRFQWSDPRKPFHREDTMVCQSIALSRDGDHVAVAVDHHVWIWHTRESVASSPLHIELPHKTSTAYFDSESTCLFVDGGSIVLPPRAGNADDDWAAARENVAFCGYGLSEDRSWIMKDNRELLYLPQDFRPEYHPKTSPRGEMAFMDSTVAIGSNYLQIFLRFHDGDSFDMRWPGK